MGAVPALDEHLGWTKVNWNRRCLESRQPVTFWYLQLHFEQQKQHRQGWGGPDLQGWVKTARPITIAVLSLKVRRALCFVPNLYLWSLSFFFVQFLWHILAEAFWVNRGRLHMAHGAVWFDFLRWVLKRRCKAYDRRGMKKTSILKIFLDDLQIPWAITVPECWTCCLMPHAQFRDCCWCSWIAAPTIRNVPKVQTARPGSGNVWIWNSLERGWGACFDWWGSQVRACKMMMLCWLSYSYRLVYGILWIGGDGWSHESTWKRGDFCESVHDCAIDVGGFKKTRRCGPCWCRNVDSCRYGNCHGPNLDPN